MTLVLLIGPFTAGLDDFAAGTKHPVSAPDSNIDQSIVDVLRIGWPKISQTCHINHLMMTTLGSSYRTAIKDSHLRLLLDKEGLQLHWLSLEAYC